VQAGRLHHKRTPDSLGQSTDSLTSSGVGFRVVGQRPQPPGLPEDQMSQDIDFSALSLRDTLDLAIAVEEEAKERYDDFAEQLDAHRTPEAAKFFRFMAANEIKHAEKLSAQRASLFGDEPNTADTSALYDIEAPEFDAARAFMSVQAALDVAMESEVKAWLFYDGALPQVQDPKVKKLFIELRDQEKRHQEMIEDARAKMPKGDDFDPDDFVDAPAAQ
jgi:rubrerythrin